MYFLTEDDDLLKNIYNAIWDKVSADVKKIDSEPVYNIKFLKTKIKSHGNEVTDCYDKKFAKVDPCSAVISLDSTLKKDDNYCPQVFLKECQ